MPSVLSLAHLTFLKADPVELIRLGRIGGFDAVGIRLVDPAPEAAFLPVMRDADLFRRTKGELSATGLALLDIEAIWLWPQTDPAALRPVLEAGAELGARNVLVAGNDPDRSRMTDNFVALCGMARECGLGVGFEFIPYTRLNSMSVAHAILEEAAQPNAGLLIDILHLTRSGGTPADIAAIHPEHIAYGHLCDAPAGAPGAEAQLREEARSARLYPGEGGLPLQDFIRALPADKPLAMECPTLPSGEDDETRAKRAGAACRRLLAQVGRPGGD